LSAASSKAPGGFSVPVALIGLSMGILVAFRGRLGSGESSLSISFASRERADG
jgi:hypothetical protein